jgi:hypothetical protein
MNVMGGFAQKCETFFLTPKFLDAKPLLESGFAALRNAAKPATPMRNHQNLQKSKVHNYGFKGTEKLKKYWVVSRSAGADTPQKNETL